MPMQLSLYRETSDSNSVLEEIDYVIGDVSIVGNMPQIPVRKPFDSEIINFLNDISRAILNFADVKAYPDMVALAYWIRKSSLMKLKERFYKEDGDICIGRGVVFHIAPSNVPLNYAYSLFVGLLTGNANITRIPSEDFPQLRVVNDIIRKALENYEEIRQYLCLVRYVRNKSINDFFSSIADTRIIWGGDATIEEIRKSPLAPRSGELTFADRYSLAVIDSDKYMNMENKGRIAESFYNDTYLTDQNSCTSPHLVVWMGNGKEEAKNEFWGCLHEVVKKRYFFQSIQVVNKLADSYRLAAVLEGVNIKTAEDNLIVRVQIPQITDQLMAWKGNSGYFMEYDCENIMELRGFCNNKRCQTVGYIGEKQMILPLISAGIKGIDRIVPVGRTMDFDIIWDGYNLFERLTRIVKVI